MKQFIPLALLCTFFLSSCVDDWRDCREPIGPEEVFVHFSSDIAGLFVECNVDVHVYKSQNPRVEVIASPNIADQLDVIFHGDNVTIAHNGCIRDRDVRVEIYTPGLLRTEVQGSGDIYFRDYNDVSRSTLKICGSGDIQYMGDSRELLAIIDGSGDIELSGSTRDLDVEIDGSGDVEGFNMQARYVYVEVDGSGDTEVWAERSLVVDIHGSGDVFFIGYPDIEIHDRGSGDVIDVN